MWHNGIVAVRWLGVGVRASGWVAAGSEKTLCRVYGSATRVLRAIHTWTMFLFPPTACVIVLRLLIILQMCACVSAKCIKRAPTYADAYVYISVLATAHHKMLRIHMSSRVVVSALSLNATLATLRQMYTSIYACMCVYARVLCELWHVAPQQ